MINSDNNNQPIVVLIPAYNPDWTLVDLVTPLSRESTISQIVIVNDGSKVSSKPVFDACTPFDTVTVLHHAVNAGKGSALKTGMQFVDIHIPDAIGVVTMDADGQHLLEDVLKVAAALNSNPRSLIMGCRTFDRDVPARSRFGNHLTRLVMKVISGISLGDTQTGLRGIPRILFGDLLDLGSTGYDFELEMILVTRRSGVAIKEVTIATIYLDKNSSSHFNPIVDSLKIYKVFFKS